MSDADRKSNPGTPAAAGALSATGTPRAAEPDDADDQVFKALANGTRRRMLDVLKQSPRTTGDLCAQFPDLDRTTVLQHLRVLERAELVIGRKVGRERHLTLAPVPIKRIHDRWIGEYARAAVSLLDDLTRE
ncbi:metalloregulator ArsR/SmtB family transcription factor [Tsukamurella sp. NPDC003166]|uniref:ArsR/SmtB family transcription factor n=1 Tax=Tsukamurella sp. NPDC003166 TaxID=3154444 RepID=UPI0033A9F45D